MFTSKLVSVQMSKILGALQYFLIIKIFLHISPEK